MTRLTLRPSAIDRLALAANGSFRLSATDHCRITRGRRRPDRQDAGNERIASLTMSSIGGMGGWDAGGKSPKL
jgi:hypothetical protein